MPISTSAACWTSPSARRATALRGSTAGPGYARLCPGNAGGEEVLQWRWISRALPPIMMGRIDATSVAAAIDWNGDGNSQLVRFPVRFLLVTGTVMVALATITGIAG